ncbi:MAG: M48 family metalloprotease [Gammaproteobacteria bacterium]
MTTRFRGLLGSLLLIHAASAMAETYSDQLPSLGDASGRIISPTQDRALGAAFMRQLRQSGAILNDQEANSYLEALGRRLVARSENPTKDFTFFLVNDSGINAFAGPAGHIGINTGLFLAAESESELAAVLAHEIAHVTQLHLARSFEAADKMSIPRIAALVAAILIGTQNGEAGAAALTAASAASLQYQINFTRANEEEADRIGIQTLANANFDPNGMAGFFGRLQKNSRLYGARPPEFLSTHPVTTNRISEAISRAESYPEIDVAPDLDFLLLQAKLRVSSYDNSSQVLADVLRYKGKAGGDTAVERYELALLLAANNKLDEARDVIEQLHKSDPDRIAYRLALASILHQGKHIEAALGIYASSLSLYPDNPTVILPYASTLLSAGQAETAFKLLAHASDKHPLDPEMYKLLARAAAASGRNIQTHTAIAQYYFLNGYTTQAIEQLRIAEKQKGISDYQSASIQAGINNLQSILDAEKLE